MIERLADTPEQLEIFLGNLVNAFNTLLESQDSGSEVAAAEIAGL